ncbi:hypothetical protein FJU08_22435 [Martelella alba]|uniref:Pectate lyase-like protein n=1 Tax=Martelella alba TaxID=2590451 RepID=A0A506TW85_9HYPH|nr:hypothetical protein [Martelella alba]TPW26333.1 hypothetical protein FJU08_22435 [Martelella alba]
MADTQKNIDQASVTAVLSASHVLALTTGGQLRKVAREDIYAGIQLDTAAELDAVTTTEAPTGTVALLKNIALFEAVASGEDFTNGQGVKFRDLGRRTALNAARFSAMPDGTTFEMGGLTHIVDSSASVSVTSDLSVSGLLPVGELFVEYCGAIGDGTTDDTAAFTLANTVGADLGLSIITNREKTYIVGNITLSVPILGGGKLKRLTGTTGRWLKVDQPGIIFDIVADQDNIGAAVNDALYINTDNCKTASTFVVMNSLGSGIYHEDSDNCHFQGFAKNCVNMGLFSKAINKDVYGLRIDMNVDNSELGTSCLNGGVKVLGTETYKQFLPIIIANTTLAESDGFADTCIGVETHTNCEAPVIIASTRGGYIGVTMNNSPGGQCLATAMGAYNLGLEIDKSPNAHMRGSAIAGKTVTQKQGGQISDASPGAILDVDVIGCNGDNNAYTPLYVNNSDGAVIKGSINASNVSQFVRVRHSKNVVIETSAQGSSVTRAILISYDSSDSNARQSDGLIVKGCFSETTFGIRSAGASINNIRICDGSIIKNTAALISIDSPNSATDVKISRMASIQTTGQNTAVSNIEFLDYAQNSECLIDAVVTGDPEGIVTAAIGSRLRRTDGGISVNYTKVTGGNQGWTIDTPENSVKTPGDSDKSVNARLEKILIFEAELTAERTVTLLNSANLSNQIFEGMRILIKRTGAGVYNLNVVNGTGGSNLVAMSQNEKFEFFYDGTNWNIF